MAIIDDAILSALETQTFSSIRELANLTCIPATTVYRHLTHSLGFVAKHLRWVSHSLSATQQVQRVTLANRLFPGLGSIKQHGRYFVVALDESWFYFATDHEQIWMRPEEEPPAHSRRIIQDRKIMVTVAWNPLGFHIVKALPIRGSFDAEYYHDNILAELLSIHPRADGHKLCIHADNSRAHTTQKSRASCEENSLRLLAHPPYSPDIAPCDFFLFGHAKLLDVLASVLSNIPMDTFYHVFEHWMERLEWMSQNNGDYYP
jgi:histone-lysine N-methyltransferase SETMAR